MPCCNFPLFHGPWMPIGMIREAAILPRIHAVSGDSDDPVRSFRPNAHLPARLKTRARRPVFGLRNGEAVECGSQSSSERVAGGINWAEPQGDVCAAPPRGRTRHRAIRRAGVAAVLSAAVRFHLQSAVGLCRLARRRRHGRMMHRRKTRAIPAWRLRNAMIILRPHCLPSGARTSRGKALWSSDERDLSGHRATSTDGPLNVCIDICYPRYRG